MSISSLSGVMGTAASAPSSYWSQLQPASFRGVGFGTFGSKIRFGRRNAVHEYPYRDEVWVEDLGRKARRITITGFLVGDDVIDQRELLIGAIEQGGPGELVHPTLGRLTVSVEEAETEEDTRGRLFGVMLTLIESGLRQFPTISPSTSSNVGSAADAADAAASLDFTAQATSALQEGAQVVSQAVSAAKAWAQQAQTLVKSATSLYHTVTTLQGSYGRYAGGANLGFTSAPQAAQSSTVTVQTLVAQGVQARVAVTAASNALVSVGQELGS